MFQISYQQLPCLFFQNILNDNFSVSPADLTPPFNVVTKGCTHIKQKGSATLETAIEKIKLGIPYACSCGQEARTIQELAQDLVGAIGIQFNVNTQKVLMLSGIICHSYIRGKKYSETLNKFQNPENKAIIPDILQRYNEQNSIKSFLKQVKQTGQQIYTYWAYCLLDRVKINIPVRIIGCQHLECYELTSLLVKHEQYQNETNKKFPCEYNGCQNYLDMTSLQTITSNLTIDKELLKILNQAPQTQFKFQYDFTSGQFIKSNQKDEFIQKFLEIHAKDKLQDEKLYPQIQQHMIQILNEVGDTAQKPEQKSIKALLNEQKYMVRQINLIDPFTQQTIEFPIRCIYCTDYTKCIDVRSMVADYEIKNSKIYKCPLCNATIDISKSRTARYLKGYFYLDQNLLSKMFKDQQNANQKSFNYNGKQYMLEEFMYKNKFSKDDYLKQLIQQSPNQIAEFKNLNCINQPQKQLKYPLIIKSCPQDNLVDFDSFYEEFQKKNYNIETDGIILCRCEQCNVNPIKKYPTELFYHEALGFALQNSRVPQKPGTTLKFDFSKGTQFMQLGKALTQNAPQTPIDLDRTIRINNKGNMKQGFIDLLDDQEYQNLFRPVQLQGGRNFQVLSMQVDVMPGFQAQCNNAGMKVDVDEQIQKINNSASDSLKKWSFKVTGMEVKVLGFENGVQSKQFQPPPK